MESEGDEASRLHPKRSKPTNHSQFPSTSMQESSLKIPILPPELITEILLKLPVKSLLQFRCVSKSWLSLISSPEFVKTHLSICVNSKDNTHHRLILVQHDYNVELKGRIRSYLKDCTLSNVLDDSVIRAFDLDYPMKNPHKSVEIVGSVNGLICLTIEQEDLFLWNTSIRRFKKLPDFTVKLRLGYCIMYGFGYDEVHDDYKVVCVSRNSSYDISHYVEVKIYSLNSDSWTSINDFHSGEQLIKWGMFMNGKLHWASSTSHDFHSYSGWDICYIDLADGKWGNMDTPCYGEGDFEFLPCLGVLGSDLSVFCNSRKTYTDVWVMKEYGVKESWTKMFTINYRADRVGNMLIPPYCMSSEGRILFEDGSTFMIYNPKDGSIRYREVTNCGSFYWSNIYIESLVLPNFTE